MERLDVGRTAHHPAPVAASTTDERTDRQDWNPRRWLRIVLPSILIVLWLLAASFGGPTFGKLSGVSTNDQSSFLPASAESTEAGEWQKKFSDSSAIPAIGLLTSETKLSSEQLAGIAQLVTKISSVPGVQGHSEQTSSSVIGPMPSQDGKASELIIPISDTKNLKTVVGALRSALEENAPDGLKTFVTGPAGLSADLVSAFGGIDGILLIVALAAVLVILLIVYRSVVLPFLVLLTSVFALTASILLIYTLASWGWITLNGQSQGILSILVIGAATDYSLLLVSRFREALHEVDNRWAALGRAFKASWEPILASGGTVVVALLCLLVSDLNSNRSLGPIAAIGILFSLAAALTLLPALLAIFGRVAFWPFMPKQTAGHHRHAAQSAELAGLAGISGLWKRIGTLIGRRPRASWLIAVVVLLAGAAGVLQLQANGVPHTALILKQSNAVDGQKALGEHFDAGSGSPIVVITQASAQDQILQTIKNSADFSAASVYQGAGRPDPAAPEIVKDGRVLVNATLTSAADSAQAEQAVKGLRSKLSTLDSSALIGGVTAVALDTNTTAQSDLFKIIPLVLAVILLILMLLLRSVLAPVLLIGSVVLSYLAALGVSALVFNHIFGFPGADASVPLFGFVFLVALGVDYNIFLMTRVREESLRLGTRPGVLRGLGVTGGVITSAGVVLAATFAALGVIPILFLAQISFIVAFGVLLDTVIVRSILVPALAYDLGGTIWWPSALSRRGPGVNG
ncbi:transporter, MMPL family [Renibacterium salmoninarum ATCC 33209]|uniref:Transporter, MMPL family n=1 Tax=Renibacterium salmoninarum (strain ATCC 33209 / DSM 20767 / JCM 11484 / NBRC 15589 / NCIMB 2235) TaxID=288705 RepID=A9WL49_RENSM|nr:MMPL family transporter [Renibacterium salmoninarum]ABY21883.1 transporter, MMPL family [Renibacterium salmoninarum ATCC 33209]